MTNQISVIESNRFIRPICPNSTILLSSGTKQQSTILEQHLLAPFEQPEVIAVGHILSVHLSDPIELEHKSDCAWQRDLIQPRALCLTPDGTSFAARWQESVETIVIRLNADWLDSIASQIVPSDDWELTIERGKQDNFLYSLVTTMRNEVANNYQAGQLYYDSLLNTLGVHLVSKYRTQPSSIEVKQEGLSPAKLRTAIAFIEANCDRNLKLREIAQAVGLSEYYCDRQFKKSLGITPHQYLTRYRIDRAKQLLKQQDLTIAQIAQKCGFSSQSYFTKQFRQIVGVTPKVYRDG